MRIIILLCFLIVPLMTLAATEPGLGGIAQNLSEPLEIVMGFIGTGSIVVGACSIVGAFLKYLQHRKNPLVAPMSTIIVMLLIGLALIGLPFLYKLTGYGIPYHLF